MLKTVDFCIIGAGSGGLSVASVAAQLGLKVVLIEHDKMGGDCLNYGCVPSKALLAAAKCADTMRHADAFGLQSVQPEINYEKVMSQVNNVIQTIAPHDSEERFTALGVQVIKGEPLFLSADTLQVNDITIQAKHFVIATGSRPSVPPIPGLDTINYLTNETIFQLKEKPTHLIIIGGGPIGMEIAQAYLMLGCKVTVLEGLQVLPKDDPDCVSVVLNIMKAQGLQLKTQVRVLGVEATDAGISVQYEHDGVTAKLAGSHLFLSTGRVANVDCLDLEKASVAYQTQGIQVDQRLRTTNKKIYAIGDCTGGFQFTHVAGYHAGVVIRNAVFHLRTKVDYAALPWVTYTAPELANVGMNVLMAGSMDIHYNVTRFDCNALDRYVAERHTEGFIKVLTNKKDKIIGASVVADAAGELILPWGLAIQNGLTMKHMSALIAAYPTRSELNKRVAGQYFTSVLFSSKMKKIVRHINRIFK